MKPIKKILRKPMRLLSVICAIMVISLSAEEFIWIAVGNLHSFFSSSGIEREIGRTGQQADQQDGLRWPAQFRNQDTEAAKAMWLGSKNFYDVNIGKTYAIKVVHVGPRVLDDTREIIPQEHLLYGRFPHPDVFVDGTPGTEMMYGKDEVEIIDENLVADRMIYTRGHTALGVTYQRYVYAFTNEYHDNYFISEYIFTNTGIINQNGDIEQQDLEDFVVFFQYRYSPTREAGVYGHDPAWTPQSASWGHNAVNDMFYTHPITGDPFRIQFTWMGTHSQETSYDLIGAPAYPGSDGHLTASQYVGVIALHADTSPDDNTDDPAQPFTTMYVGSDLPITSNNSQFNDALMADEYAAMTAGRPSQTHAIASGCPTPVDCLIPPDNYMSTPGGFSHGQGFGPYALAFGDSVRIVVAEGVSGISRDMAYEVGANWLAAGSGLPLPEKVGGGTTDDEDYYKNAWVWTGEDSLVKTFERSVATFQSDFDVPDPPRPPTLVQINSGGDRITLTWEYDTGIPANVAGFKVYRARNQPDTSYTEVFACGAGTDNPEIVSEYIDTTPIRGFDYYYYLVAFDDGSTNNIEPGVPLVSSKFWTMTSEPASLKRSPASPLEAIRIVPNPYNIKANALQFGASGPDRIMFYNVPAYCMIRIYTERGDLIKVIDHTDGSGDESWDSVTSSRQIVVSGLYIAYIEASEDWLDPKTGIQVKKGQSVIKKFVIIR